MSLVALAALVAFAPQTRATVDSDGDGYLEGTDCDDLDESVWALPGEAHDLHVAADKYTLSWSWTSDLGSTAARGDLLRSSTPSGFSALSSCSSPDLTTTTATDTSVPAPGHAFFYLVRNRNACGDGSLGSQSNGTPRSGASCDCTAICDDGQACTSDRCANGACVHAPVAAVIEESPDSIAVCPGQSATFRVRAGALGTGPVYAWKKNGAPVGTNSPTLTLSGLAAADNGAQITCVVTTGCSPTTSAAATLTVFPSAASCAGGLTGQGAPNGASEIVADPARHLRDKVEACLLDGSRSQDDGVIRTYLWSGELRVDRSDLTIAGRGLDFSWDCTYLSRAERLTPMGWNWDFNYNRYITSPSSGTLYVWGGDGRRDTYTMSPGGCFTSPGLFRDLCPQPDGSYVLTFADRSSWTFAPLDGSPAQGKWLASRDTSSNEMHATYDSTGRLSVITDTLGRPITVSYDTDGYISAITDFGGRSVTYGRYLLSDADGMPGDLKSVTSPAVTGTPNGGDFPDGKTTTYVYTKNTGQPALDHNLLRTHHPTAADPYPDPKNRVVYTSSTNPTDASFDRVQGLVFGDDPFTPFTYVYTTPLPAEEPGAVSETIVRDRAGDVTEFYFDASNRPVALREYTGQATNLHVPTGPTTNRPVNPLRATDPPFYRTKLVWSPQSNLTEITFPELDKVQLTYDSANADVHLRGNLLQRKRLAGPRGGDQTSTTESWTYTSFGTEPCPTGADCPGGAAWKAVRGGGIRFVENQGVTTGSEQKTIRGGGIRFVENQGVTTGSDRRVKVKFPVFNDDSGSYWARICHRTGSVKKPYGAIFSHDWTWSDALVRANDWHWSDGAGGTMVEWTFEKGWPCRYEGPRIDAQRGGGGVGGRTIADTTGPFNPTHWEVIAALGRWHTYTDPLGHAYTQDVDPTTGNVLQVTAPPVTTGTSGVQNIVESWAYNSHGQVVQHTDPSGRVDTMDYETSGPATGYLKQFVVDAQGPLPGAHLSLTTIVARDQYGNPTAITNPNGHTETFVVNQLDQVVRHVTPPPFSYTTDFRYDASDDLVRIMEPNIAETGAPPRPRTEICKKIWLDSLHRPVRVVEDGACPGDPEGGLNITTEFAYAPTGGLALVRLPEAVNGHQPTNTVSASYDERGLPLHVTRAPSDPQSSTTQWDYDGDGNVVTVHAGIESSARIWRSGYDGHNRLVSVTDPMENVTTLHYDANDDVVSTRVDGELVDGSSGSNVRLSEELITYDEIGRPVQVDAAHFDAQTGMPIGDGVSTTRTYYEPDSLISRVEDDNGHGVSYTYDTARRLFTGSTPSENTGYTYDANGNLQSLTQTELSDHPGTPPQSYTTTFTLDELDRTTSVSRSGITHTFAWDSRSPGPVVHLDGRGNETRFVYDALNRPLETHRKLLDTGEGGGNVVTVIDGSLSYDPDSRLVSQTDDNGHVTTYDYDPLGRVIASASSDGAYDTMTYDVHDNLVSTARKNGAIIVSDYDYRDHVRSRTITLPPNVLGTGSETYQFDGLSRMVSATNDTSHVSLYYDSLSNVTREVSGGSSLPDLTVTRTYDGAGNCTSVTYPSGLHVTTTYDAVDRRKTITAEGPGVCLSGPPPHATCSTPADCGGTACTMLPPATTTYDYAGGWRVGHQTNGNSTETTITYDDQRRPTRTFTTRTGSFLLLDDRRSTWDAMSNRTSRSEMTGSGLGTTHSYGYDSQDRLVHSVMTPAGSPPVPVDYTLDGVGNRVLVAGGLDPGPYAMSAATPEPADAQVNQYTTTPSAGACTYDAGGAQITRGGGSTLKYDFRDRLVLVSGSTGPYSAAYDALGRRYQMNGRRLVYDGEQEIEERGASGGLRRATVYGNGIDQVSSVVADVDLDGNPERTFYHTDDQGDVTAVTSSLGEKLESYDYDDYGKPRFFGPTGASLSQSAIGNPILFNGRRYDPTLGVYDYRTRTMDPRTGRFLTRNSIGTWGDTSDTGNGYTYVGNNPWSGTDPSGAPKVPKAVLKEYFQAGDKPTQAQFATLLDSMVNFVDDRDFIGLREYGYHRCGNQCVSDDDPQSCGSSRITKPGMDKLSSAHAVSVGVKVYSTGGTSYNNLVVGGSGPGLTMDPGTLWMAKLCPGSILCPDNPFGLGSSSRIQAVRATINSGPRY